MAANPPPSPSALARVASVLNAAWLRPVLFLVFLVVLWDVTIRVFRIPPYQIPKPEDVLVTLWTDWPTLLQQAIPTTVATVEGFLLSAVFGVI
ncbi:MAG: ABC transporter permease, partial [Pseudolabrys sp.]